jgi:hypothetical protein
MFNRGPKERMMTGDRFIAVSRPSPAEGVGRALQVAFRDGFELPADMRACLDRLDRITI